MMQGPEHEEDNKEEEVDFREKRIEKLSQKDRDKEWISLFSFYNYR